MKIAYRPDIDGLRAVAVLGVVGFHAFPEVFPGGFIGVDVFFVISGFLITSIIAQELEAGQWSLSGFYARRVLRIFPALALLLAACLMAGWFTLLAAEYKQLGKHVAAGAGFVANLALWSEAGYFDRASELKPLLHLWSLGIEEQFYIAWPLLLAVVWRPEGRLRWLAAGLLVTSFVAACVLVLLDRTQAFYSPVSRAWELLAGAGLALAARRTAVVPSWTSAPALRAASLAALLLAILLLRPEHPFPGALALVPVLAAAVLIGAKPAAADPAARILGARPLVGIGLVSYPLYLWHWPLLSFGRIYANGEPPMVVRMLLVVGAGALSALTFRFVEKPVRKLSRSAAVAGLLAGVAILGAIGANVYTRDGLERIRHRRMIQLDAQALQDFVDFEQAGWITDAHCEAPFRFPERDVCLIAHPDRPVTAVALGDSHAVHAFWGLARALEPAHENLKVMGKGGCVPLLGFRQVPDLRNCQPEVDDTVRKIARDREVHKVLIIFRGRYLKEGASPKQVEAFRVALDRTVTLLASSGKQVHYFLPVAEPGFDPRLCLGTLPLGRKPPHVCEISLAEEEAATAVLRGVVRDVMERHPEVRVVDPNPAFCQDGVCPIVQQGHSVFKDDNHLSHFGSLLLGSRLRLD